MVPGFRVFLLLAAATPGILPGQSGQPDLAQKELEFRKAVSAEPQNVEYLSSLGSILGMEQKFDESIRYLQKALALAPGNVLVRRNLASSQFQLGQLAEADRNLRLILKTNPGDPKTVLLLGIVKEHEKDYAEAIALLQTVPELVKREPESTITLALAYYGSGDRVKGRAALLSLSSSQASARGALLGSRAASDSGDFDTAEELLNSIRSGNGRPEIVQYNLALVEYRAKRYSQCRETLVNLLKENHQSTETYTLLVKCYHDQGDAGQAGETFDQVFDRAPHDAAFYLELGRALAANNLLPTALAIAKRAVAANPESAQAYCLKGDIELEQKVFADSIRSYSHALELDHNFLKAHLGLTLALWGANDTSKAAELFEEGLKRFPQDSSHYVKYAELLLDQTEKGERDPKAELRARALLETANKLNPNQAESHYQLGSLLLNDGRVSDALTQLQIAERLDSLDSRIHYALSRAYRRLSRAEDSRRELQLYEALKN